MADQPLRIAGWLLVPLAWLLMSLLGTSLAVAIYLMMLVSPDSHQYMSYQGSFMTAMWYLTVASGIAMWAYTLWLTIAFFKRRQKVIKHYMLWLLLSLLLAVKAFALSPVSDELALRQLMFPLIAAALFVPYLKRSLRVKRTFINP